MISEHGKKGRSVSHVSPINSYPVCPLESFAAFGRSLVPQSAKLMSWLTLWRNKVSESRLTACLSNAYSPLIHHEKVKGEDRFTKETSYCIGCS